MGEVSRMHGPLARKNTGHQLGVQVGKRRIPNNARVIAGLLMLVHEAVDLVGRKAAIPICHTDIRPRIPARRAHIARLVLRPHLGNERRYNRMSFELSSIDNRTNRRRHTLAAPCSKHVLDAGSIKPLDRNKAVLFAQAADNQPARPVGKSRDGRPDVARQAPARRFDLARDSVGPRYAHRSDQPRKPLIIHIRKVKHPQHLSPNL